jgi:hypothetical protein
MLCAMQESNRWNGMGVLLLPMLAIGGAAWWTGAGPGRASREPFRLVVERVERLPATPRDVAEGFDARFVVSLGHRGAKPAAWGETPRLSGSGRLEWKHRSPKRGGRAWQHRDATEYGGRQLLFDPASQSYKYTVAARVANVPAHWGDLQLQLNLDGFVDSKGSSILPVISKTALAVPLRRAGEVVAAPANISRFCPLKIRRIQFKDGTNVRPSLGVTVFFQPLQAPQESGQHISTVGNKYFEDENGKRYPTNSTGWSVTGLDSYNSYNWWLNRRDMPSKARRLTFHTRLSLGETWPINIRVVLWDKTPKPTAI